MTTQRSARLVNKGARGIKQAPAFETDIQSRQDFGTVFSCRAVVDPSGSEQTFFVNSSANIGDGGGDDEDGLMTMMMDIMMTVMMILNRFDSFSLLFLSPVGVKSLAHVRHYSDIS
jgi:hypothetical protein